MRRRSRLRDGLCRTAISVRPHHLLGAVCVRSGLTCPEMPTETAQTFLDALSRDPTRAIRLVAEADEIRHYTKLRENMGANAVTPEVLSRQRDLDVLQRLGLAPGDTRRARYLYELLFDRLPTLDGLCAGDTPGWEGCPHAREGVYEQARAAGRRALVPARAADEMAAARREHAERIAHADRLFIRPHHLMCLACWYAGGEGQGPRPNDLIYEIHERLRRDPQVPVTLVEGCCDVCWCCDGFDPETTRCVHAGGLIRDYKKDLDLFRKLGLAPGATLPARDLVRLLLEKVTSTTEICGYGDGIVRSEEWRVCGGPEGNPGYVKSRETGVF